MKQQHSEMPPVRFLHSTDGARKPFTEEMLSRTVFIERPGSGKKSNKPVSYPEYLRFIKDFLEERWDDVAEIIGHRLCNSKATIDEIEITAEKSGSDYHPASIRFLTADETVKFVANIALTGRGRSRLKQDFLCMEYLYREFPEKFVPQPFLISSAEEFTEANKTDSMVMFLAEWLEDFHEFHATEVGNEEKTSVVLWDTTGGSRILSTGESEEIYRWVAFILSRYFDLRDYREVFPWHHAAGDFVAKVGKEIAVKLVTVRQYEARIQSEDDLDFDPNETALLFLCNLTIRNRLDRLDGIGELVWISRNNLRSTVDGFFQALELRESIGEIQPGFATTLKLMCQNLDLVSWTHLFGTTLASFNPEAPDYEHIEHNLPQ
ncbi:MAG: hypothetical protein AB7V04_07210, partial [Desulfomonilaceae bacterium]